MQAVAGARRSRFATSTRRRKRPVISVTAGGVTVAGDEVVDVVDVPTIVSSDRRRRAEVRRGESLAPRVLYRRTRPPRSCVRASSHCVVRTCSPPISTSSLAVLSAAGEGYAERRAPGSGRRDRGGAAGSAQGRKACGTKTIPIASSATFSSVVSFHRCVCKPEEIVSGEWVDAGRGAHPSEAVAVLPRRLTSLCRPGWSSAAAR